MAGVEHDEVEHAETGYGGDHQGEQGDEGLHGVDDGGAVVGVRPGLGGGGRELRVEGVDVVRQVGSGLESDAEVLWAEPRFESFQGGLVGEDLHAVVVGVQGLAGDPQRDLVSGLGQGDAVSDCGAGGFEELGGDDCLSW